MRRTAFIIFAAALAFSSCDRVRTRLDDAASKLHRDSVSDPVSVRAVPVSERILTGSAVYVGTVESSRNCIVTCPASGTVADVYVREGKRVSAGEKLARIESQTLQSAYDMAMATLNQAKDGMERLEKVYAGGGVPEIKMVEMKTNLEKAEASANAAGKALDDCVLKAPFAGVVESLEVSVGEDCEFAKVIMRIVDPSSVEIRFPLPENEYSKLAVGDGVEVEIPAIGARFDAKVSVKGSVASRMSHSYECSLGGFKPVSGLMPGMACKVHVTHGGGTGTVVPATSVMTDGNGRYVWVVRAGVVDKAYVRVDGYSGKGIVVDGLTEGDSVIVEGMRKVSTGMAVKIVD